MTYKDKFMKNKTYSTSSPLMYYETTQFKNSTITTHTKFDSLTQILVLMPKIWVGNVFFFTKHLQKMK